MIGKSFDGFYGGALHIMESNVFFQKRIQVITIIQRFRNESNFIQ